MSFFWLFFRQSQNFALVLSPEDDALHQEEDAEDQKEGRLPKDPALDAQAIPLILQEFDMLAWKRVNEGDPILLNFLLTRLQEEFETPGQLEETPGQPLLLDPLHEEGQTPVQDGHTTLKVDPTPQCQDLIFEHMMRQQSTGLDLTPGCQHQRTYFDSNPAGLTLDHEYFVNDEDILPYVNNCNSYLLA